MELPRILKAPVKLGLAAADTGFAVAEQAAGTARGVVKAAADRLDPHAADNSGERNLVTAIGEIPFIIHRVSDLLSPGGAVDRLLGDGGAGDRIADLFNEDAPVDRVIKPGGPLDRATREGGVVEVLTAEDGVVSRIADMTEAVNRLTPTIAAMNRRIADIEGAVGRANSVAEPVSDLLSNLPKFALRTANEVARAAGQPPRRPTQIVDAPIDDDQ